MFPRARLRLPVPRRVVNNPLHPQHPHLSHENRCRPPHARVRVGRGAARPPFKVESHMNQRRTSTTSEDQRGRTIVLVPLANHLRPARLLLADFEALKTRGVSDQWTMNEARPGHCYVRASAVAPARTLVTIARVLLAAPPGRLIGYRDGDRTNLLRENLYIKGTERRARRGRTKQNEGGMRNG